MSNPIIAALNARLESERKEIIKTKYPKPSAHNTTIHAANAIAKSDRQAFKLGHEAATERLMAIVEKAVEMVEFYADRHSWDDTNVIYKYDVISDDDLYVDDYDKNKYGGKKAREFLAKIKEMK